VSGISINRITQISGVANSFGPVLSKDMFSHFNMTNQDMVTDTNEVRDHAAYMVIISYCFTILAVSLVFLLPRNKDHVREMKEIGGRYPRVTGLILAMIYILIVYSITVRIMSMYQSTQCYKIAGGNGCS